jgi:hypothetical protein
LYIFNKSEKPPFHFYCKAAVLTGESFFDTIVVREKRRRGDRPRLGEEKMANRRLISKSVIYSERALDMPAEGLKLYIYMMLEADDDGFLSGSTVVLRMAGLDRGTLELLKERGLVYEFKSGVCVIAHWLKQNLTDRCGYSPTEHILEKSFLDVDDGIYCPKSPGCLKNAEV